MFPERNHRLWRSRKPPESTWAPIQGSSRQSFEGSLATCPGTTTCKPSVLTFHGFRSGGQVSYTSWDLSCTCWYERLKPHLLRSTFQSQGSWKHTFQEGHGAWAQAKLQLHLAVFHSFPSLRSAWHGPIRPYWPSKEKPRRRSISLKVAQWPNLNVRSGMLILALKLQWGAWGWNMMKYVYSYMVSIISNGQTPRALCFTYLLFGWCLTMSYHNKLQFEDFLRPLLDINWMVRSMLMSSKGLWWCVTWHFCFQTLEIFSRIWHQLGGCKMSPVFFPLEMDLNAISAISGLQVGLAS